MYCIVFYRMISYCYMCTTEIMSITCCLSVSSQVLKGGQEVGGVNQDGWILLFTRDPATIDMFTLVPNVCSDDDKEENNLYINRLVFFHS